MASQQEDPLVQIHLMCYLYLVQVEGVYDEAMRFLYAIHLKAPTAKANLHDIKIRFEDDGVGLSLFDGWCPVVRNAIGHASYSVDLDSRTIEFDDLGKIERLSLDDFRGLLEKVVDVSVLTTALLILRVLVPLNFVEALNLLK